MTRLLAGCLLVAALAPSPATGAGIPYPAGTWKGTIGSADVMVCLRAVGPAEYYYVRHRRGIALAVPGSQDGSEREPAKAWSGGRLDLVEARPRTGEVTGRWRIEARSPTELAGTWTDAGGARRAPIALVRAPEGARTDGRQSVADCSGAFYEPIRMAARMKYAPATFNGREHRTVATDQARAIALPPQAPHAEKFNRFAIDWLRDREVFAYDCNTAKGTYDEPLDSSLEPVVWTERYLVLRDVVPDTDCGGAHGSSSLAFVTWSLADDRAVDTWTWLRGGEKSVGAIERKDADPVASPLMRLVVANHPRNAKGDDCADAMNFVSVTAPYPTAGGLVFPTEFGHAMRACGDEVVLRWNQVAPHLSREGQAVEQAFRR